MSEDRLNHIEMNILRHMMNEPERDWTLKELIDEMDWKPRQTRRAMKFLSHHRIVVDLGGRYVLGDFFQRVRLFLEKSLPEIKVTLNEFMLLLEVESEWE